jgi:ABC-2 type transport system ATP-binding protein
MTAAGVPRPIANLRKTAASAAESMVAFSSVSRRFGEITAVEDLTFDVPPGETVALLGPNGAGKTTTVKLLLGLLRPSEGAIHVLGSTPEAAVARGGVGVMLQEGGLPDAARVRELVDVIRRFYPSPLALQETLRLCDLERLANRRTEALSGGERQRVRLALALAGRPELLVLDEPTEGMDVATRRGFWERVREYGPGNRSILFATHRLEEAEEVAARVLVLARGRLAAAGSPRELKTAVRGLGSVRFAAQGARLELLERLPAVESVEVEGEWVVLRASEPQRTVRALLERFPELENLEVTSPRLEDAFIELTREEDNE